MMCIQIFVDENRQKRGKDIRVESSKVEIVFGRYDRHQSGELKFRKCVYSSGFEGLPPAGLGKGMVYWLG
jgi:hypothetical protein